MGKISGLLLLLALFAIPTFAQTDSTHQLSSDSLKHESVRPEINVKKEPDTTRKKWSPAKRAAIYSAVLPGAGQIYNKKYWKLPIVYGAIGVPAYTFSFNLTWFQRTRYAYNYLYDKQNPIANRTDTLSYNGIHEILRGAVDRGDLSGLQNARNSYRRDLDYSVLAFILLWGLNVVDAAVDGHFRDFDISDDLSIQIRSGYMPVGQTTGFGVVLNIGKNHINRSSGR